MGMDVQDRHLRERVFKVQAHRQISDWDIGFVAAVKCRAMLLL